MNKSLLAATMAASVFNLGTMQPARAQINANIGGFTNQQMLQSTYGYTSGEYYREEVRRAMREGGRRTGARGQGESEADYGRRIMASGRATTRFATRPMPVAQLLKQWAKTNPRGAAGARAEWQTQSNLWRQAARERGARFDDMADMYALAIVMSYEAYTGKHLSNAGFEQQAKEFSEFFASMSAYQGYSARQKQDLYEAAMLSSSDALRLRRAGKIAEARTDGAQFLNSWATGKLPGALETLAPFEAAAPPARVAAPPARVAAPPARVAAPSKPAIPFAQAQRAVRFTSGAPILPAMLAAQEKPAEREEQRKLYATLLAAGRDKMRGVFPSTGRSSSVAQAMSYAVMTFYTFSRDAPEPISAQTASGLERQFTQILGGDPKFRALSARQKQQMFESTVLMAATVGYLHGQAQKSGDAQAQAKVRQMASGALSNIVGMAPEKVRLTQAGLQF